MKSAAAASGSGKRTTTSKARAASRRAQRSSTEDKKDRRRKNLDFEVNLGALNMNTLKRYKRHYNLKDETPTKRDLVELVTDHFRAQEMSVSEQETILLFSHMIKNNMSKLDKKRPSEL
mmetsp:Transcript_87883/g.121968  ORF Transcript_87883/g.121968 Transcript_87883/m.121968 type:complete len:119 (-) Transcript_87883:40-396(-)